MSPLPADLKDELQKEYASTFDEKIKELEEAMSEESPRKLREIFHKLAGSGKTYEMEEISNISRQCEELLTETFPKKTILDAIHSLKKIFKQEKSRLNL